MTLILYFIIYMCLCSGLQCQQLSWLPCQFTDEHVLQKENLTETERIHREAMLQFGLKGDAPVNPHAITFLVITGSRLDLRRYIEEVEPEQLGCELRRYSTQGIHVRWPVQEANEYNAWFQCTIRHTKGLFTITSFLRRPSDQPPSGKHDYLSWTVISDREILTTTAVMVIKTQSPSVISSLGAQQKLHCQFAIDHKGPNMTVDWYWQSRGERHELFSHNSRSGQTKGSGVALKGLVAGEASYTLPYAKTNSEGTYICSLSVMPLFGSVDIALRIEEAPRVSLNVGPTLLLQEGGEQKVICEVERYYPLDVEIVWYQQDPALSGQRVGAPLPKKLENILLSSHKRNRDDTYSLSGFFYLQASLSDSGKQFTCHVSHKSLRMPIKKSFILTVEEPSSFLFTITTGLIMVALLLILYLMLPILHRTRQTSMREKPY